MQFNEKMVLNRQKLKEKVRKTFNLLPVMEN